MSMRIGYIEDGYLRAEELTDGKGKGMESLSEDEIREYLDKGLRIVDDIDDGRLGCGEGQTVIVRPYVNGDRISFAYETVTDGLYYASRINELKSRLAETDYKIIKCYEASLAGEPMPYDFSAIHTGRQELRDKINELEALL